MKPTRIVTAALAASLLIASPALAGPWTQNQGHFYLKVEQGFFVADSYVDASGQVIQGTQYLGATTSLYAEVGVWKGLHLMTYLPYSFARNTFDDGGRFLNAGGGDAQFGVQYSPPLRVATKTAVRVELKVPFYDMAGIEGPLATQFPAFGDGQLDVTFWLSAGYSLRRKPLYFLAEVGYRHRTEVTVGQGDGRRFGDGFVWLAQVGYTIKKRVGVSLTFGGVVPFREDAWTKGYVTLGPAVYVPVWRGLALEARFDPILWARNSSLGFGMGFGLSYKR
jgi:hypothetical protein